MTFLLRRINRDDGLILVELQPHLTLRLLRTPLARALRRIAVKKPIAKTQGTKTPLDQADQLGLKEFPNLRDFFLKTQYDDGDGKREPGCLIIRAYEDQWSFTLKEPSQCLQLRLTTSTWDEGLLTAEAVLGDPSHAWETDAWAVRSAGKRKPKT